jgi:IS5 family transposase
MARLRDDGPGRAGYPVLVLFKAVLLQSLYGLSERELEDALGDRLSFRRFVGWAWRTRSPDRKGRRDLTCAPLGFVAALC